jgi:flavin reductase (DIM6/NTAB) family NADH-FMN oxidoreductase RutF
MALDPKSFRQTIGQFATGVTVIVAQMGEEVLAMTANAVSSLSLDPTLVLFCPAKKANMAQALDTLTGFSVNILREDQQALSTYFAGAWKEQPPPPFRFVPWAGAPRLEGCLAALGCERHQVVEAGDHWIVIGRVVALHQGLEPRRPLLFYGGKYGRIDQTEGVPAPELGFVETPVHIFYDPWEHGS